jgi:hypothetical protein
MILVRIFPEARECFAIVAILCHMTIRRWVIT